MEDQKEIEPRYMTQGKKQYYLASVDENMTQLLRGEIDSLTKVLIELKSQYDDLTRESNVKKMKTDELTKKINALKDIDKKSQKKINMADKLQEDLQGDIKQKRITLRVAQYQKKTLMNTINKLNQDILLTQKQISVSENKTKWLNKHYDKEKFKENQLKENKDDKFINLFYVKRKEKGKNKILKTMYGIGNKYNKLFMDYNIFLSLEKFICDKDQKKIIVQYK